LRASTQHKGNQIVAGSSSVTFSPREISSRIPCNIRRRRGGGCLASDGKFLGTIPGPQELHGTFFGSKDKKTLFACVFYGGLGTPSARNKIIAIPTIAQGYTGRAK
jgi:hypothetical protein